MPRRRTGRNLKADLAAQQAAMTEFVAECKRRGIRLRVWVGWSLVFGGYAVCYGGNLADVESAERHWFMAPSVTRHCSEKYPGSKYCSVHPVPQTATPTWDEPREGRA